jgi:hypothetical protein
VAQREGRANGTMVDIRGEQIAVKAREKVDVAGLNSSAEIISLERDRGAALSVVRARLAAAEAAPSEGIDAAFWLANKKSYGHRGILYAELPAGANTVQVWRPATGQRLGGMPAAELQAKFQRCGRAKVRAVVLRCALQ